MQKRLLLTAQEAAAAGYDRKGICIVQTKHIIQWIRKELNEGSFDNLGYSAPSAVYELLKDMEAALKTEVEAPESHEGPEGQSQS